MMLRFASRTPSKNQPKSSRQLPIAGVVSKLNTKTAAHHQKTRFVGNYQTFVYQRRLLFDFGQAPRTPIDAADHADLLKTLNAEKKFKQVIASFEKEQNSKNLACLQEYLYALSRVDYDKFSRVQIVEVMKILEDAPLAPKMEQQPSAAALLNNTEIPNSQQSSNNQQQQQQNQSNQGSSSSGFTGGNQGPIEVKLLQTTGDKVRAWIGVIGSVVMLGVIVVWFWGTDEKKSLNLPVANAHTEAINVTERFDDVKGIDEVRSQLEEIVDYLKNPKKYENLGAKLPRGILLTGEPGTGKTLLARAIAGEAGVPFFFCSGASFDELFVGVGPKRVRALFEDARKASPCIIFIDEIDAMGMARKYSFSGSHAKESTLNQLLVEMDGFKQNQGIIVIGATNLGDALDSALTRPGRFDKQIAVPMPDIKARKQILELYLAKIKKATDVDPEVIAKGTVGFSGADLANLINQAAIKAATREQSVVDMKTIDETLDENIMGIRHKNLTMNPSDREKTAYHEAGHTLLQLYTEGATPLYKVTIIPRGQSLGVTVGLPDNDRVSMSRKQMFAHMAVCMGGKIAEEMIFGNEEATGGCSSDLQTATNLARAMVTKFGMSEKLGNVYYEEKSMEKSKVSEMTMKVIDDEIISLTSNAYKYAQDLLKQREKELHRLAKALIEHESLNAEQVKKVVAGHSLPKSDTSSSSPPKNDKNHPLSGTLPSLQLSVRNSPTTTTTTINSANNNTTTDHPSKP